jgi:membrane-associated phospholipid phosphatase
MSDHTRPPGLLALLRPVDALVIAFLVVLPCLMLAGETGPLAALQLFSVNAIIAALVLWFAFRPAFRSNRLLRIVRDFYPVLMIFVIFKEVHVVTSSSGRPDFDELFIAMDRWLFGGDPTVWMAEFATPALTELLQVSYTSYYFLMLALGVGVYRLGKPRDFQFVVFAITFGFVLSYLVGPRFTLHEFGELDADLPGLFLTETLRQWINAGESIPPGAPNPMALAQRDVFPSGHTQMTVMTMYYAHIYRLRSRLWIYVLGGLLIVGTVYLRYHYVIDLIAGAVFAAITIRLAPKLFDWWQELGGGATDRG